MAASNPVLYNIGLSDPGRSTGVFRRVSTAQPLSGVAEKRTAATERYNADVASSLEGLEGRKVEYDALVKSLQEGLNPLKSQVEEKNNILRGYYQVIQGQSVIANQARRDYAAQKYKTSLNAHYFRDLYYSASRTVKEYTSKFNTSLADYNVIKNQYDTQLASAKQQQQSAYDTYAGEIPEAKARLDAERRNLEGMGYLAGAIDPALTPEVASTGSSLASTDLYSNDLDAVMVGRKNVALSGGTSAPTEDIVTGAIQSSLWR